MHCTTERHAPIMREILFSAVLREDTLSGNPPFKAAFVGAPPQWGFARHGRGLRRVRGMRRRSFASEGSRERSEAPEGAAGRRAHALRMPCRLSGRPSKAYPSLRLQDQSICGRTSRAGSGDGLPVLRDAKCAGETRSVSEETRADCEAIERTSVAKCPQGGANEPRQTVR